VCKLIDECAREMVECALCALGVSRVVLLSNAASRFEMVRNGCDWLLVSV
jgi:elongation factor P--beta-lysine ligase